MISISASVMAYSLKVFFDELEISRDDAAILASGCSEAGLNEVIDLALIEPAMVPMILGPATDPLGPTLLEAAAWAEKVAEGWARGERNMIGGGPPGVGVFRWTLTSRGTRLRPGRPGGTRRPWRSRRLRPGLVLRRRGVRDHQWPDPLGSSLPLRHGP